MAELEHGLGRALGGDATHMGLVCPLVRHREQLRAERELVRQPPVGVQVLGVGECCVTLN